MMLNWKIEQKQLDLKYTWKISRGATDFKLNFFISVGDGKFFGMGEVAPNIRYNETPERVLKEFQIVSTQLPHCNDLTELTILLNSSYICNSLRFGIESAYIHYCCHKNKTSIFRYLGVEDPGSIATSFSLPIMAPGKVQSFIAENNLRRFKYLKVKVDRESALDLINEVAKYGKRPLIVDANEAWGDVEEFLRFEKLIFNQDIIFIEQPLPSKLNDEYVYLKSKSGFEIFADESVLAEPDFDQLQQQFHGINMKLMKAGGYIEGIRILDETSKRGMKKMIGCMVETTLGISSGYFLSAGVNFIDLDSFLLIKNEPFKLIQETEGELSATGL
jgi:L-Ala-D/L-Glu epimerase